MFRRRLPFIQMAFATLLGVAGGVYIYRPYFEPLQKTGHELPKNQIQSEEFSLPEHPGQIESRGAVSEAKPGRRPA